MAPDFEELLDSSLQTFRQRLLDAYLLSHDGHGPLGSKALADMETEDVLKPSPAEGTSSQSFSVVRHEYSDASPEEENSHGDVHTLPSDLEGLSAEEANTIRNRLRLRLGVMPGTKLVSGHALHEAISALGLTRYTEEEELVNHLADFVSLRFNNEKEHAGRPTIIGNIFGAAAEAKKPLGSAIWEWPEGESPGRALRNTRRPAGPGGATAVKWVGNLGWSDPNHVTASSSYNVVPAEVLIEVFLARDGEIHKKIFGAQVTQQLNSNSCRRRCPNTLVAPDGMWLKLYQTYKTRTKVFPLD
eukprot:s1958_g5.t1